MFGAASATIFCQVTEESFHGLKAGGIDHRPPIPLHRDEFSLAKAIEMKRQSVWRHIERFRNLSGRQTLRPCPDEQTERVEAVLLRERSEHRNGLVLFHISILIEISSRGQEIFRELLKLNDGCRCETSFDTGVHAPCPHSGQRAKVVTRREVAARRSPECVQSIVGGLAAGQVGATMARDNLLHTANVECSPRQAGPPRRRPNNQYSVRRAPNRRSPGFCSVPPERVVPICLPSRMPVSR
jgi:hypothetical protein